MRNNDNGSNKMNRIQREIQDERDELQEILRQGDANVGDTTNKLKNLAGRVGASTWKLYPGYSEASIPELVANIHQALQTKSVVAALRTSLLCVYASIALAMIALGSTIATWVALFRN